MGRFPPASPLCFLGNDPYLATTTLSYLDVKRTPLWVSSYLLELAGICEHMHTRIHAHYILSRRKRNIKIFVSICSYNKTSVWPCFWKHNNVGMPSLSQSPSLMPTECEDSSASVANPADPPLVLLKGGLDRVTMPVDIYTKLYIIVSVAQK